MSAIIFLFIDYLPWPAVGHSTVHPPISECTGYIQLESQYTGVVMIVYLHEALDRRLAKGGELTELDIRDATIAG